MINSIKNGDQPLPTITQVSIAGATSSEQPHLKDKSMCNKTAKDLWDALERHMLGFEYGNQDRKAVVLYEYKTFKASEGELLIDTYIRYLQVINDLKKCGYLRDNYELNFKFLNNLQPEWKQYETMMRQNKNLLNINIDALYNILKKNQGDVNDAMKSKKNAVVITSDPLALVAKQTKVSKRKEKVVATSSTNKKQEYVKYDDKKEEKKVDEKKRDISKVKCYNCKKEGHFCQRLQESKVVIRIKRLTLIWSSWHKWKRFCQILRKAHHPNKKPLLRKQILFDKMSRQLIELDENVRMLKDTVLEKDLKIYELDECVRNKDLEIKKCLERLNECESELHKIGQTNQTIHMIMPSKDKMYYGSKGIDTLSSVRRPKYSGVTWKKKWPSNTSNVVLSFDSHLKLNKDVKRYSRNDLLSGNNSLRVDTRSAYDCNDAMKFLIVHICLWIIDSGCSKHMMGNHTLLTNIMEKFLGTVRFGNNDFTVIAGYGDVGIGSMTIKKVYYVEDLLTGDHSLNLYTIALNEMASHSSAYLLAKASYSQSLLWHQRISYLNFATINNFMKNNLVRGLPKMKFKKDHLCSACEQRKIHRKHYKSKTAFALNKPLYLLYMDLCGPMRIESINKKRYVLVVVDDYSRYTWFFCCKNATAKWCSGKEELNLSQSCKNYAYICKHTIVFWAEAIATTCFTQNSSIIHKHFDKNPYELINKRKPNIKFFHVFVCRCYLLNDYDNVGKHKEKGDIGVFVGYLKESAAFKIYNKHTRKKHESVNVNFDEISEMASKQFSLEPDLSNLNKTGKSSTSTVSHILETSKKDLEDLFYNFYDEYFASSKIKKSLTTNVETSNNKIPSHEGEVFHEVSESFQEEYSSSSLNDDVQQSSEEVMIPPTNTQSISNNMVPNVNEASSSHNVFNERLEDAYFDAIPRPDSKTIIKTKWIFKNKKYESSLVIHNKARLIAVGYYQQEGIDYDETFAPVTRIKAIRLFLEYDAHKDFTVFQRMSRRCFSIEFLKRKYMLVNLQVLQQKYPDHVYALDKALYGLKQAPRAWYNVLSKFLIDSGFQKCSIDTTLLIKNKGKHIMLIQIYIDDIIFGSMNPKYCMKFSDLMVKHFEMSMMGEMKIFLGIQVNQFSNGIFINQSKYILDILKRFGMDNCDMVPTPMVEQDKLKLNLVGKPINHTDYRNMIGSLMYLTLSRPDIMFATYICARYQANPNEHHVSAVNRIFRYLKWTINLSLWYPKDSGFDLTAYSDADYAGSHLDRKKSKYVAISGCCAQILWMHTQLTDYGFFYDKVPIYCDSKSAIAISCNPANNLAQCRGLYPLKDLIFYLDILNRLTTSCGG
nr:hypothetical protein [Tanacetum cinerariifolium]